ncbi:DUF427-domain-containing protein [Coniochaeta hoffmannii]|uniref:DUF427-domain-containing protein n=1 Tax=Coniochaeta hoffmannii TaxID=91930 RepID=A0AA38SIP7_9PEZI|nr:DUF427-domain-containing protein [Coniochaeta hoffmannii]
MSSQSSLSELATKLATNSPAKYEPANRRVRALLDGKWLFDTLKAVYVWEHPYYPLFYVPLSDLEKGPASISKDKHYDVGFWIGTLSLGEKKVEIAGFDSGPLKGLVKIPVGGIDSWFAEDEKLVGPHPKDPYKRIECLPSSREIRIEVDGAVVARSTNNIFLHETSLRTRYYLSPTSVLDWSMLDPSDTSTFCPYKGQASYYHLRVGEREIKDAVWYYTYPTAESAQIQNRLCFYNEKVDVYVDGVKEE